MNKEYEYDVSFNKDGRKLNNNLLDSNLSFFCNSYIEDQRFRLNSSLYKEIDNQEDVLVIYTLVGSIHHFLDKRINSNFFLRMWVISVSRTLGK